MGFRARFEEAKHLRGKKGGGHGGQFVAKPDTGGSVAAKAAPGTPAKGAPSANPAKRYNAAKVSAGSKLKGRTPGTAKRSPMAAAKKATPKAPAKKPSPGHKTPRGISAPSERVRLAQLPPGQTPVKQFGMRYHPGNEEKVEAARTLGDGFWSMIPVQNVPKGTPIEANEEGVKQRSIDKVTKGTEPFKEGYHVQMLRTTDGKLHVIDGHTRVAMYHTLGRPVPAQIIDEPTAAKVKNAKTGETRDVLNDVAIVSTQADFDNPENTVSSLSEEERAAARVKATEDFVDAVQRAPDIRDTIRKATKAGGGRMEREYEDGLPTACKTEHSIGRKVQKKIAEAKEQGIDLEADEVVLKDTVRFTTVFGEDDYVAGIQDMRAQLEKLGYELEEPPPDVNDGLGGWALGDYRGLNMNFRQNGFSFEVQVHTEKSLAVARLNHKYYDMTRAADPDLQKMMDSGQAKTKTGVPVEKGMTPADYKAVLNDKQYANVAHVSVPKGMPVVRTRKGKTAFRDVIVVPHSTGHYSAGSGEKLSRLDPLNVPPKQEVPEPLKPTERGGPV